MQKLFSENRGADVLKVEVKTGLSDGSFTEIKSPTDILGQEVVLGISAAPAKGPTAGAGQSNPFMPKRPNSQKNKGGPPPR